jgi:hypothetical protein
LGGLGLSAGAVALRFMAFAGVRRAFAGGARRDVRDVDVAFASWHGDAAQEGQETQARQF